MVAASSRAAQRATRGNRKSPEPDVARRDADGRQPGGLVSGARAARGQRKRQVNGGGGGGGGSPNFETPAEIPESEDGQAAPDRGDPAQVLATPGCPVRGDAVVAEPDPRPMATWLAGVGGADVVGLPAGTGEGDGEGAPREARQSGSAIVEGLQPEGSRMPELSPSEDRAENSRELRLAVAELSDRMGALAEELEHQRGAREAAEERAAHAEAAIQDLRAEIAVVQQVHDVVAPVEEPAIGDDVFRGAMGYVRFTYH